MHQVKLINLINMNRIATLLMILCAINISATTPADKSLLDIDYVGDSIEGHRLDIYLPDTGADAYPAVILIYGSAWFADNAKGMAFNTMGKTLLDNGFAVAAINHRSSMKAKYPAQIQDVKAAIRYVRANAGKYGIDPSFIAIGGFSSGGHLSALAGATNGVKRHKAGETEIDIEGKLGEFTDTDSHVDAVVDWFGPIDMSRMENCETTKDGNSPEAVLIGGAPADNPELIELLNPMTYINADCPKFLVIHGDADDVVPHCQSVYFSELLDKNGILEEFVTVPGGGHGPVTFNDDTFRRMTDFLKKELEAKRRRQSGQANP